MINTTSKNNSFICVQDACESGVTRCQVREAQMEPHVHPLRRYLRDLWMNVQLFFETDKWDHEVTLKVGDSHYTMKMEDIEARWRNR